MSGKEAAGQENLDSLEQNNALSSKDQELAAKRQRLKNEESMDTTDNLESTAAPTRADVRLAEEKPASQEAPMGRKLGENSSKEFTRRPPHPILKGQTEPEFEGKLGFLSLNLECFESLCQHHPPPFPSQKHNAENVIKYSFVPLLSHIWRLNLYLAMLPPRHESDTSLNIDLLSHFIPLLGRDAVRLIKKEEKRCEDNSTVPGKMVCLKTMLRMSKVTVMVAAMAILVATSLAGANITKKKMI